MATVLAKGNKGMPPAVNGVKHPSLLPMDYARMIPPYLHLILGLVNNVVQQMLVDLTGLGCQNPAAAMREIEYNARLAELEDCIAVAVDEVVAVLRSKEIKRSVKEFIDGMNPASAAAPPGVAAPGDAECVMQGQIAEANWEFLITAAAENIEKIRVVARHDSDRWLTLGSGSSSKDSDSDDDIQSSRQLSSSRQKPNRYVQYAQNLLQDAEVKVEEIEAAVKSLQGAIAAFKAADIADTVQAVIDEGFGTRALKTALDEFGINVQRYWNGAVRLPFKIMRSMVIFNSCFLACLLSWAKSWSGQTAASCWRILMPSWRPSGKQ